MASSPTEVALRRIDDCYCQALEAVGRADLERVKLLVEEAGRLLGGLVDPAGDTAAERALRQAGAESHGRLTAAVDASRRGVLHQLQKVRQGVKILQSYGHRSESVGTRIRSEG